MSARAPGAELAVTTPAPAEYSAVRAEIVLARAIVFFRACGLVEVGCVLALDWRHYRSPALVLLLAGAVLAESVLLVAAAWWRGEIRRWWVGADVAFLVCCLAGSARLTAPADGHTWVYFMYPFTVITCYSIGIAYRRQPAVIAVSSVLAGGYALSAIMIHHDPPWNVLPNAAAYYSNIVIAWAAAELRRSGRASDASHAVAIAHAADLARERERARHARMLHDRVLQTLEALVHHGSIVADRELSSHIAAEAAWLRALVQGTPVSEPGDLLSRLQELAAQRTAAGLRIEFNNTQLRASGLRRSFPPEVTDAVVAAVGEALTNIVKHSGTRSAIMRATVTGDQLTVSVLDHGAGFDPCEIPRGIGLAECITGRLQEVGGSVHIESAPGAGTYVELTIPVGGVVRSAHTERMT
ncbi:MAG: ATP-binding protein [Streptosporangiaceae bacterium]|nr:ATP-binding protein [Streptosporangiaceae bacterium]MBV9855128.1 ATP-binding protein [Streptosporangiaceae bacterium]